ncbi:MAG: hypothetical protein HQ582_23880, partial [Planctomycetes bacterium]|nr:hypothetical protein [Planctomycetota bacterium]
AMFSGNPDRTPRYNYNQILYKLDLSDPRLVLPVAFYNLSDGEDASPRLGSADRLDRPRSKRPAVFFACDRPAEGMVPVYEVPTDGPQPRLHVGAPPQSPADTQLEPLFYALPPDAESPPDSTVPLYRHVHSDGQKCLYLPGSSRLVPDYRRVDPPLCLVWRDPTKEPPP